MLRYLLLGMIYLAVTGTPLFSQTSDISGPALVRGWYRQYFHREPEPRSVAVWSYLFRLGNSREAVLTKMLSTDEYYRRAGETPDGLAKALFDDGASNTTPLEARNAWLQRARNLDRRSVATQFVRDHPEALRPVTDTLPLLVAERRRSTAIAIVRPPSPPRGAQSEGANHEYESGPILRSPASSPRHRQGAAQVRPIEHPGRAPGSREIAGRAT